MKAPVIILYDRVFEKHRVYFSNGFYSVFNTFEEAQAMIAAQVNLQEVYINSKPGREILKRIGSEWGRLHS